MQNRRMKNVLVVVILFILITVQTGRIIYTFTYEREGYHPDECSSYAFANSFYDPYIYMDYFDGDIKIKNFNEWISSQLLRDFLVVNTNERFAIDSVIYNSKYDMSPPLYSIILHTVCSFFPETFSWNYAFFINVTFFILSQIVLYFLGVSLTKSRWIGLITCLFYGFTTGALNCFIFLRMYAVLTFLAVLSTYLHSRMYNKQFQRIYWELILIISVTLAGVMTHYYYYVFAFFLAICYCVYLACKKLWKILLLYSGSMLLAVGLSFIISPNAIPNMIGGTSKYPYQMTYRWNLEYCVSTFMSEITGFHVTLPDQVTALLAGTIFIAILLLCTAIGFLVRKERWFSNVIQVIKQALSKVANIFVRAVTNLNWAIVFLFFVVLATLAIIAKISFVYEANIYVNRYLFFLIPLFCVGVTSVSYFVLRKFPIRCKSQHLLLLFAVIIILLLNNYLSSCNYIFQKESEGQTIEQVTKNANCIIVTKWVGCLNYYNVLIKDTSNFFALLGSECMQHGDELSKIDVSQPVYIIIEQSIFPDDNGKYPLLNSINVKGDIHIGLNYTEQQFLDYLADLDWVSQIAHVCTEKGFTGSVDLYRLN